MLKKFKHFTCLEVTILRSRLKGRCAREHSVDVAFFATQELFDRLRVAISSGLYQLLGKIARDLGFEQDFEPGRESL